TLEDCTAAVSKVPASNPLRREEVQAAGSSLDRILTSWTSSRLKGLLAGTLLTAAVQSSSVVTMAIIGFANAGLITFQRAVWMMFGSNPGTTATAWIVASVGLKFQIDA